MAKKPTMGQGTTVPLGIPAQPFDVVYADILTLPLSNPVGPHGRVYSKLLIFVDGLTRWVEAAPLPHDPTAEEVVEVFIDYIISRHGVPRTLVCDRGSNLIAQLCREVYTLLGVDLRPSTAYHHETAALVERFNRTLAELIRASSDEGKDWPLHVPWLCFFYRATAHASTHATPAYLNLGRELRYPADRRICSEAMEAEDGLPETAPLPSGAATLAIRLRAAWAAAQHSSQDAQQTNKERRDLTRRDPQYAINDWVLLRRPPNDKTGVPQGGKLAPIYSGPYRIQALLERGNVTLRDLPRRIHNEFHVSRLRPYLVETDEIPLADDEYKVKAILDRRGSGERREYKVHWVGWPKNEASWEPRVNLLTRCFDELTEYDTARDGFVAVADQPQPKRVDRRLTPGRADPRTEGKPRSLVARECWPNEECLEHEGRGWEVVVTRRHKGASRIRFVNPKDDSTNFAEEWVEDAHVTPLTATRESPEPRDAVAAVTLNPCTNPEAGRIAEMLHLSAQPSPPTKAAVRKGIWFYERYEPRGDKRVKVWVDWRSLTRAELEAARPLRDLARNTTGYDPWALRPSTAIGRHLDPKPKPLVAYQGKTKDSKQGASRGFTLVCPNCSSSSIALTVLSDCPYKVCRKYACTTCTWSLTHEPCTCVRWTYATDKLEDTSLAASVIRTPNVTRSQEWAPLDAAHAPDLMLLRAAQNSSMLGLGTTEALAGTLTRSRTAAKAMEEKLKDQLNQPCASSNHYERYIEHLEAPTQGDYQMPTDRRIKASLPSLVGKFNAIPLLPGPRCSLLEGLDEATQEQVDVSMAILAQRETEQGTNGTIRHIQRKPRRNVDIET